MAAYLVKLALDVTKPENMIPWLLRFTSGISGEFDEAIQKVARCIEEDSSPPNSPVLLFADSPIPPVLGEGWIGEEAVALGAEGSRSSELDNSGTTNPKR